MAICFDLCLSSKRNKKLKKIPSRVFQNKQLKILIINNNKISVIPAQIGDLERVREFYLVHRNIRCRTIVKLAKMIQVSEDNVEYS